MSITGFSSASSSASITGLSLQSIISSTKYLSFGEFLKESVNVKDQKQLISLLPRTFAIVDNGIDRLLFVYQVNNRWQHSKLKDSSVKDIVLTIGSTKTSLFTLLTDVKISKDFTFDTFEFYSNNANVLSLFTGWKHTVLTSFDKLKIQNLMQIVRIVQTKWKPLRKIPKELKMPS